MESLRTEAREEFLRYVVSESSECHVLEIKGSGNNSNIVDSESKMHIDEVPSYLKSESGQPTFKLVVLHVGFWLEPRTPNLGLAWIPDGCAELGIDPYWIGLLRLNRYMFRAMEYKPCKGKFLNLYANSTAIRIVAANNEATSSTICVILQSGSSLAMHHWQCMVGFLRQNKALFQSPYLLQLSFLAINMDKGFKRIQGNSIDWDRNDEDNLQQWEELRKANRWGQRTFSFCREIVCDLRKQLDTSRDLGSLREDVVVGNAGVRDAVSMMEPWIGPILQDIEWQLQSSDDYMAGISRAMMRQDTIASIELARVSVELTKAAKADSSSMKVIAVMTMIFLPGTFFAALFAVPSLDWDNQAVVGDKFWVYWAFTIPFTLLIIFLWLVITQRSQMRNLFDAGKKQWKAKSHLIRRHLLKRERTADVEEAAKDR